LFYRHLTSHIEAVLFAWGEPLPLEKLAAILEIPPQQLKLLLGELKETMASSERGLTIVEVAGGYQICTKPELAEIIERLNDPHETKLSPAALETLAIVAFKQPITRQEIENIRGVKIDRVLNTLVERRLIKEQGRKDAVGRPILYGTTLEFLQCFGLKCLKDLPSISGIMPELQSE